MPEKEGDKPTRSRTGRLRALLQVLVAIAAWAGFAYLWYVTLAERVTGRRPLYELIAIAVTTLAIIGLTRLWIRHNLNIYQRKGPRRRVSPGFHDFSHDWLNRPVGADWQALQDAKLIDILIKNNKKSYMPEQQPRI